MVLPPREKKEKKKYPASDYLGKMTNGRNCHRSGDSRVSRDLEKEEKRYQGEKSEITAPIFPYIVYVRELTRALGFDTLKKAKIFTFSPFQKATTTAFLLRKDFFSYGIFLLWDIGRGLQG